MPVRRLSVFSVSVSLLAASTFVPGCLWRPKFEILDGKPATEFVNILTGTGGGRLQPDPLTRAGVRLTYLGTGGYVVERGEDVILLAPFFSHHWYLRLGFWKVSSDKDQIKKILAPMATTIDSAAALLVGHAHYDHLLDVRFVVTEFARNATVFGNQTMANILAADPNITAVSLLDTAEQRDGGKGRWTDINNGRVRFMAIRSHHAPNFAGLTIANGTVDRALKRFPKKAGGMEVGETLAFMIDFMDTTSRDPQDKAYSEVALRIYYQDSAQAPAPYHTLQFNPTGGGKSVDVVIACVAVFTGVQGDAYPETMKQIFNPKQMVLGHWENFFLPRTTAVADLRTVPNTDPVAFTNRLDASNPAGGTWVLPIPGTPLTY